MRSRLANDTESAIVNADLDGPIGAGISYSSYELGKDGGFGRFAYPAQGNTWESFFEWTDVGAGQYVASVAQGPI